MEPHIKPYDKEMFYKYLNKASHYFEFGGGGSTYQAAICPNIESVICIESSKEWIRMIEEKLKNTLYSNKVDFQYIEIHNKGDRWGHPSLEATSDEKRAYSNSILSYKNTPIDFILIDGRFRVACALKTFSCISDTCIVAFDDFLDRSHYHIVLDYYELIDKTEDNSMAILRKKNVAPPSDELLQTYELIAD